MSTRPLECGSCGKDHASADPCPEAAPAASGLERFIEVYRKHLAAAVQERPEEYSWSPAELDVVLARMKDSIVRKSYVKDTPAFKRTCKELMIKHTYAAINAFVAGEVRS